MKINKKAATVLAFGLGAVVFVTTAFADVAIGSGYDRLKGAIKHTTQQMDTGMEKFTFESMLTFSDNGKALVQQSSLVKVDNGKKAFEELETSRYSSGETETRSGYADSEQSIWRNSKDGKYYITEYKNKQTDTRWKRFDDPFKEKGASEIEKIFDGIIGSLKNNVQVEEKTDGGREYSGSLSEVQVPALVNAVASFAVKKNINGNGYDERYKDFPEIESDMYIKKVTGSAVENKSGLLENLTGEIILVGKDKGGTQHELVLNVAVKLKDVGTTVVQKPDLAGKEVEFSTATGFDSRYEGKFKNDIIIEKDGKFEKAGERTIEILGIEKDRVKGKYYETAKPGFESYNPSPYNFTFEFDPNEETSFFSYKNPSGVEEKGRLFAGSGGMLYLSLNLEIIDKNSYRVKAEGIRSKFYDDRFTKVFDE